MKLYSNDLQDGMPIDPRFAFGRMDRANHMALSDNRNPHLAWRDAPAATESFALLCMDPDVPATAGDVNQEGKLLPVDMPRCDFCHWALVDIPPGLTEIEAGSCSHGVTAGGKSNPAGPAGSRQGINDYTGFMAGSDMAGDYYGYDGPCPPWNDLRLHHYIFTLYALDVPGLDLADGFTGHDVIAALQGRVLAKASIVGTYTLNPDVSDSV